MFRESLVDFLAIAVSALIVGAALFFIFNEEGGNSLSASSLTVEEVYAQVEQKLRETDGVLHVSYDSTTSGPFAFSVKGQQWLDGKNQLAREELDYDPAASFDSVATQDAYYLRSGNSAASMSSARLRRCNGAGIAASTLLGCPAEGVQSARHVEEGRYQGRDVIVLVEVGTAQSEGRTLNFTHRLFLDATTLMPFAANGDGSWDLGQPTTETHTVRATYTTDVVALTSLAIDFFLPEAVGYVAPDPQAGLRSPSELQAYWLGPSVDLPGIGRFVLQSSAVAPDRGRPYKYSLTYAKEETPREGPFVTVQLFFRDIWDQSPADPNEASFIGSTVVYYTSLPNGDAPRLLTPAAYDALKAATVPYLPDGQVGLPPADVLAETSPEPVQQPGPAFVPPSVPTPRPPTATAVLPTQPPPPPPPPEATATLPPPPSPTAFPTLTPTLEPTFPFEDDPDPTSTPPPPAPTNTAVPPTATTPPEPTATTPPEPTATTPPESPTATPEPTIEPSPTAVPTATTPETPQ